MSVLPAVLLALAFVALTRRHPRWPARRTAAGLAGLAALGASTLVGDASLTDHMVEHQLIAIVAAPLLVAAAPVRLALGTLARGPRDRLASALRSRPAHVLAHPATGLGCALAVLATMHVPAVYDATLRSPALHGAEHAALLGSSLALWATLVAADPLPHPPGAVTRLVVLVVAMTAMAILGAVLATAASPIYAAYPSLTDQQTAGGIMWMGSMIVTLPVLLACVWSALAAEERRQTVRDARGLVP